MDDEIQQEWEVSGECGAGHCSEGVGGVPEAWRDGFCRGGS